MIKVKDEQGNEVPGLFKDSRGVIVVKDDAQHRRYMKEKNQAEIINNLVKEISELRQLVDELIESNRKSIELKR